MKTKISHRFLLFMLLQIATGTVVYAQGVVINGVRWATCNVDKPGTFAANPEDSGMLYQWNSAVGWSSTDPLTSSDGRTQWDEISNGGDSWTSDNDPCPAGWRTPTKEEFESLLKAPQKSGNINGIKGWWFGKGENHIFMPIFKWHYRRTPSGEIVKLNSYSFGLYWSNSVVENNEEAFMLALTESSKILKMAESYRSHALRVRCVAVELFNE